MKKYSRLFIAAFFLLAVLGAVIFSPLHASADAPRSVIVAIQQINPDGNIQKATCTAAEQRCLLSLTVNAGQTTAQSLNIKIGYAADLLAVTFETDGKTFYAGNPEDALYYKVWTKQISGPATYRVILVGPPVQEKSMPFIHLTRDAAMNIPHPVLATLEVTLTPGP